MSPPDLPSVLPPSDAVPDTVTTLDQINAAERNGKITDPDQTPIYICALQDCFRLYPSLDRLMLHRKRDHNSDTATDIITWNSDLPDEPKSKEEGTPS
ncbi:hypothetical protein AGABI2DRAFT_189333 [Agaricus bisporus var. bisporus H97]|uniref:hypothetical protein n=1 Tax=Agaricus bisporus var. bisporus (strain H97 / ATCC MYA-4626 / FGSC 10389) TaxID=936046 RepID=UPI00029F6283|nr:hypothetical protein AGABI2DRAFT_189333 [Agaricus bisporus var. bisporus H97]EKV51026.1 hypothetical protein AGABI2DRAFT_189333 [Agaricus bisporus var. bisporus H97]